MIFLVLAWVSDLDDLFCAKPGHAVFALPWGHLITLTFLPVSQSYSCLSCFVSSATFPNALVYLCKIFFLIYYSFMYSVPVLLVTNLFFLTCCLSLLLFIPSSFQVLVTPTWMWWFFAPTSGFCSVVACSSNILINLAMLLRRPGVWMLEDLPSWKKYVNKKVRIVN